MTFGLRQRVALWCAALVVASGVAVVLLVVVLSGRLLHDRAREADQANAPAQVVPPGPGQPDPGAASQAQNEAHRQAADATFRDVRTVGLLAVLGLSVVAVGAAWIVAGRIVRPIAAVTGVARDITADSRLDRRIAYDGPPDELHALADAFDGMVDRLETVFDAQRAFVANASHELRTPLAVMQTEVDVALDDPTVPADELRASLVAVRHELRRTNALVAAMLALARAETLVDGGAVDLADVGRVALDRIPADARAGHEVVLALAPAVVTGDPVLLDQLIGNLVANAFAHNRPGGTVAVTTGVGGTAYAIVENDGPVVPPEVVASLFDRFVRTSGGHPGGHGLGLAIARTIVDTHGGTIRAEARPDGGLRVEVLLHPRRPT